MELEKMLSKKKDFNESTNKQVKERRSEEASSFKYVIVGVKLNCLPVMVSCK